MSILTSRPRALAVAAIVCSAAFLAKPAQAWWHGGFFIGVPPVVVAPAPVYPYPYPYPYAYPYPPAYYPPAYYPPAAYPYSPAQPQAQSQGQPQAQYGSQTTTTTQTQTTQPVTYGSMCYAGLYNCAAPANTPVGSSCSCPALGAPSYGSVQ